MEERKSHFERPTSQRPPSLLNIILIVILVAFVAGLAGAFFGKMLFFPDQSSSFNFGTTPEGIRISIDQPLAHLVNKNQKSIAGVYKIGMPVSGLGKELFSPEDYLGSATVVTSDGWLLSTDQVIKDNSERIVLNSKIYAIEETKKDQFSNVVFIKINADNLSPINFQLTDNINIGEKLFSHLDLASSLEHSLQLSFLQSSYYYPEKYLYSDKIDYYLQIGHFNALPARALGAPFFNLNGYLLGVAYRLPNQEIVLLPSQYLRQAVRNLLNDVSRPKFGLRYVDMSNNSGFEQKGNIVFHPQLRAVESNSVAAKAGLRVGDIIVAINNDAISSVRSLTSIIQNYRPGDKVIIKILRNNIEMDLEATL